MPTKEQIEAAEKAADELAEATGGTMVPADAKVTALAAADDYGTAALQDEEYGQAETLIPFIRILQANSPEVVTQSIKGARGGMILNTATQEVFDGDQGIGFIGAARAHNFAKFKPRQGGEKGGFFGLVPADDPMVYDLKAKYGDFKKLPLQEKIDIGNGQSKMEDLELVETFYLYGCALLPGWPVDTRAVIPFASTQIKKFKQLTYSCSTHFIIDPETGKPRNIGGRPRPYPFWAHKWHMRTMIEKNAKGTFYGWNIQPANGTMQASLLLPSDPLFRNAQKLFEEYSGGAVRADYQKMGNDAPAEDRPDV